MRVATFIIRTMIVAAAGLTSCLLGQQPAASNRPSESLKAYLRDYLSLGGRVAPDTTTRITVATVKTIEGNPDEVIVYVSGQRWCGSGGCTMIILEHAESTFRVLGRVTIVQLPVRLLPSINRGHPDIGVSVQGGGIQPGYEAVLSFNGKSYPGNPSMPPARKTAVVRGKVIIANSNTEDSVTLYE